MAVFISSLRDLDVPLYLHCYNHFIPLGFIFRLSFLGFNFFKPLITYCKSITYLYNAIFGFYPDGGIYFIPSGLDVPFYLHCYNHFIPLGFIFRLSFLGFYFFKPLITYCKSITYLSNATFGFNSEGWHLNSTPKGCKDYSQCMPKCH
jgi:hypothetical protein